MTRGFAGAVFGILGWSLVASCSLFGDDDDNDNNNDNNRDDDDDDDKNTGGSGNGSGGEGGGAVADGPWWENTKETTLKPCASLEGIDVSCGQNSVGKQRKMVSMILVMDKSGSMTEPFAGEGGPSRWDELKGALSTAMGEVKGAMNFGLVLYPNQDIGQEETDAEKACAVTADGKIDVPLGLGNETVPAMVDVLNDTTPGGGTPIATGLTKAHAYFQQQIAEGLPGDKYVLLATDGGANCNSAFKGSGCSPEVCTFNLDRNSFDTNLCGPNPLGCLDDQAVLDEIEALAADGIKTYVVGIPGSEPYSEVLDNFAVAGETALEGEDRYYRVGGDASLVDTFRTITVDLVKDCEIELDEPAQDPDRTNVAVNCELQTPSEEDDQSGWSMSDDFTKIYITGEKCNEIKKGVDRIDVFVGCTTIR